MPKRKLPKQSNPLATRPLPQEPTVTATIAEPSPVVEANPPSTGSGQATRDTLARLLYGDEPTTRAESYLLRRWHNLARLHKYALAFEWGLPYTKKEDRLLAETAMKELGARG